MGIRQISKIKKVIMSKNDYELTFLDAEELGEESEETTSPSKEEEEEETEEEEVTM